MNRSTATYFGIFALVVVVALIFIVHRATTPQSGILVFADPVIESHLPLPVDPDDKYKTQPLRIVDQTSASWIKVQISDGSVIWIKRDLVLAVINADALTPTP